MSDDFLMNLGPSTSSDSHQSGAINADSKRSFPPSEHGLDEDEPKEKKGRTMCPEAAGTSKNTLQGFSQEPSSSGTAANNALLSDDSLLDYMDESATIADLEMQGLHSCENAESVSGSTLKPKITQKASTSRYNYEAPVSNYGPSKHYYAKLLEDTLGQQCAGIVPSAVNEDYEFEQCNEDFSNYLPILVMEKIFLQLPFRNLLRARSVCQNWKQVIDDTKFLMWRKAYYEVRAKRYVAGCWLTTWSYLDREDVLGVNCFDALIRFMDSKFQRFPPSDLEIFLRNMPSYSSAKILLLQKFEDSPLLATNLWCILTVIILLSVSVEDLYKALSPLITKYERQCTVISEALFCIATILLYFVKRSNVNQGIHYRLYYILYSLENKHSNQTVHISPCIEDRHNGPDVQHCNLHTLTYEQLEIVNHQLGSKQIVKICSPAGTGKTTALAQFAKRHSELKILYLTTTEMLREVAKIKFPSHVDCNTPYSLIYDIIGRNYEHKLLPEMRPLTLLPFLHDWENFRHNPWFYARSVALTIDNFCQSADQEITLNHVLFYNRLHTRLHLFNQSDALSFNKDELLCSIILNEATELWQKLVSLSDKCPIWPNIYLKLFQLDYRTLPKDYDCIIVDQAEDCYAATLDFILSKNIPVFLIGDSNQRIDLLQNPKCAWADVVATHTYCLTKSLRFGPEIAYITDNFIEAATHKNEYNIIGNLEKSFVVGTVKDRCAIISHTYENVIKEAIRLCCTEERLRYEPAEFRGAFVGGISGYGINQMIDICKLKYKAKGRSPRISDPLIKTFDNYRSLEIYAHETDQSLALRLFIINKYGSSCLSNLETVKRKCSHDLDTADIIFCTVADAKGLDFDTVILANDFPVDPPPGWTPRADKSICTVNGSLYDATTDFREMSYIHSALYTALTRAKTSLVMCEALWSLLLRKSNNLYYPVETSVLESREDRICPRCAEDVKLSTHFAMIVPEVILSNGMTILNGPLCEVCSESYWYCTFKSP